MNSPDIENVRRIVERVHNCKALHIEEVAVIEKYGPETVWKGVVYIFRIEENPKTDICYAWSSLIKGSKKRRYYTVLKIPPIDSPEKAVRASIVRDYKKKINES